MYAIVHAGVPCNTWSSARFLDADKPGFPKPMRTRDYPSGGDPAYPLSVAEAKKCKKHTKIFLRAVAVLHCASVKPSYGLIALENPKDYQGWPKPSIFNTDETRHLREVSGGRDFVFDQCRFGPEYMTPTQILSNADLCALEIT